MKAITLFVDSKKFTFLLFSALFFVGLGYILLLPAFEGFDESAHYSRIREIENSASSMFEKESYIDQVIIDYVGPMPYSSGSPPYSHENTYDNFFNQENFVHIKNLSIIEKFLFNKSVREKIVTTKKNTKKYLPKYSRFIKLFFQKYAHKYDPKCG
jgi:hypothetical protein